jgi:hypothetical protein
MFKDVPFGLICHIKTSSSDCHCEAMLPKFVPCGALYLGNQIYIALHGDACSKIASADIEPLVVL